MSAIAPIPPAQFRELLVQYGFRLERETEHNWTLFKSDAAKPVITLPKHGEFVSVTIMMGILDQLKIDNGTYFELLSQIR